MAKFPALPLWTDAWIADTHHLNYCHRGLYHDLLVLMWRSPGCRVPNDKEWLAAHLHISIDELNQILIPLVAQFCKNTGHWLSQKRLTREFLFLKRQSKVQSSRAKSRWHKQKGICPSDATSGNAPTPTPTPLREEVTEGASAPSFVSSSATTKNLEVVSEERPSGRGPFEDWWQQYPHKVGKRAAMKSFFAAVKRAPLDEIMAGLLRYAAKTDDRPWCNPSTWLNQDRWQDEPAQGGNGHGRPKTLSQRNREWVEQLRADEQPRGGGSSDAPDWPIPDLRTGR